MTITAAVCDPAEDLTFIEVRCHTWESPLDYRKKQADDRRRVLAAIRDRYRQMPVEDDDDDTVIGFGQRETATVVRPPRRQSAGAP